MLEISFMPDEQPTVVYIMGYGRSGSTLLDVLLSNHPDVVSAGALINLFDWVEKGEVCACGSTLNECVFWSPITQEFFRKYPNPLHLKEIQTFVEARRNLRKLLRARLPTDSTSQYAEMTRDLFTLIANKSGKKYVVDSSKSARLVAGRAYALHEYASLNIKVIYLVRDGRGVVWSAMKRGGSPEREQSRWPALRAANALVGWSLTNLTCLQILNHLGQDTVLLVRYEDLVSKPTKELQRIENFLGLSMDLLIRKIETHAPLSVGHNLGGNRLRFSGDITIHSDFSWRQEMPLFYKLLSWGFVWPLIQRYGYSFAR